MAILAWTYYFQGRFEAAYEQYGALEALAKRSGNLLQLGWSQRGQAQHQLRAHDLDGLDETIQLFEQALENFDKATQSEYKLDIAAFGGLTLATMRRGDASKAQAMVIEALDVIRGLSATSFFVFEGVVNYAEVLIALLESDPTDAVQNATETVLKTMHDFAKTFPISQPRTYLYQGTHDWVAGKVSDAHKNWQRSRSIASDLGMPFEHALALYEIGRHTPEGDPQREELLTEAIGIFEQLETPYYQRQAQIAAQHTPPVNLDEIPSIAITKPDTLPQRVTIQVDLSDLKRD